MEKRSGFSELCFILSVSAVEGAQLREWEAAGIRLRPLGNPAYVACLPLLCQGSKWLNVMIVWLVFRTVLGSNPGFFPWIQYFSLSQKKHYIYESLLSFTANNIKSLNFHHHAALVMATRTTIGGLCVTSGPLKVAKFNKGFSLVQPWESEMQLEFAWGL